MVLYSGTSIIMQTTVSVVGLSVFPVVESYFLSWFVNSAEVKVLHVGAEWMNILRGRIMGLKLVERCWNITALCQC